MAEEHGAATTGRRVVIDHVADAIAEEVADLEEVIGGNAGWERAAARAAIAELVRLGFLDRSLLRERTMPGGSGSCGNCGGTGEVATPRTCGRCGGSGREADDA